MRSHPLLLGDPMKISELSKSELLGLIYHHLPSTHYGDHPCFCAVCGVGVGKEPLTYMKWTPTGRVQTSIKPLDYICDKCNEDLSNEERPAEE
jgi:hypothetical protein